MSGLPSALARIACFALMLVAAAAAAQAPSPDPAVQTSWRLIDYVAVDYPGAVRDGRILSQSEYAEMREFAGTIRERVSALPPRPGRDRLIEGAQALEAAVTRKAPPPEIAQRARALGDALLRVYPVPLAPTAPPDLKRGERLFAENCVSCHGMDGRAQTPMAARLDPHPVAFADRDRARRRSLFALYQVISQGLEGTAMQSFSQLPSEDRWALAFHVGRFAFRGEAEAQGARLWQNDPAMRAAVPDLQTLARITPEQLAGRIGPERATALTAYLRADPAALTESGAGTLSVARALLDQSLAAYRRGEREHAGELALHAYLDGFEPVENLLGTRDASLVPDVEREMGALRAAIGRGAPQADVAARVERLQALFAQSEAALAPEAANSASTFLGAFAILVREGLEALLIVVAMITFLIRAERRKLLVWVHWGWIGALAAGVATWWAAQNLVAISGAGRELTEGFGSLLAAAILLFVGVWMHGKAQAGAWQAYVQAKMDRALNGGSHWLLFGLAFVAVYREVFETIIFYAALGAQGQGVAMVGGIAAAVAVLAAIAWALLRLSARLPIAKFFQYSAVLIAVLAVVLAGKGMAALQEGGLIGVTPLAWVPRSAVLGLFPTLETFVVQLVMIALLAAGWLYTRRKTAG